MPGTPATSPTFAIPRFSNADTADFSAGVNSAVDAIDANVKAGIHTVIPVVTALPTTGPNGGSLIDGQQCFFQPDAGSNPQIKWHLRYNAGSVSTYKWEFVGGAALYKEVQTQESTSAGSYVGLTTPGPSLTLPTLPNGGDFDITIGAQIAIPPSAIISAGTVGIATMSYDIGGTGAVDADGAFAAIVQGGSGTPAPYSVVRTRRKTALASGTALVPKYKSPGATEFAYFADRFLTLLPVRVG